MRIEPLQNVVYLKTEANKVGALDVSSTPSAVEYAEVIAVGKGVENINVGDKVFVKSWAIDLIFHEDEWYKFCNVETNGILAIVHE